MATWHGLAPCQVEELLLHCHMEVNACVGYKRKGTKWATITSTAAHTHACCSTIGAGATNHGSTACQVYERWVRCCARYRNGGDRGCLLVLLAIK